MVGCGFVAYFTIIHLTTSGSSRRPASYWVGKEYLDHADSDIMSLKNSKCWLTFRTRSLSWASRQIWYMSGQHAIQGVSLRQHWLRIEKTCDRCGSQCECSKATTDPGFWCRAKFTWPESNPENAGPVYHIEAHQSDWGCHKVETRVIWLARCYSSKGGE